jgi:metallo-beta-lactamase family protein
VDKGEVKRVAYTGDIGRPENRILRSPDAFPQCDYLITESTYGDRLHPARQDAEAELLRVVKETCAEKGGKLIIPSFAIGRTQELVHTLNNFFNDGLLPRIKIYVDSPLAVNATEIFRLHPDCFNNDVHEVMETDPDPFGFSSLHYIKTAEESKRLNTLKEPCVIISASGMMEAGRIKHHLANNISNPRNTILAVGYCGQRTLGARILRGDSEISIFGVLHEVKAKIERIEAFSGHADYKEMIDFLNCQAKDKVKRTFLVHGDFDSANAYKGHLLDDGYKNVEVPELGQEFEM